jgi:cytochrome oxidase Cu insertion factor (SCO1/SenC/PrrC family)
MCSADTSIAYQRGPHGQLEGRVCRLRNRGKRARPGLFRARYDGSVSIGSTRPGSRRRPASIGVAVLLAAIIGAGIGLALSGRNAPAISASNPVQPVSVAVLKRITTIPLVDEFGHRTDLAAFDGRIVVIADFMTSCQEECPITTGALLSVHLALAGAHLLDKVTIVEISVDPWRDVPSRLLAYSKAFGIPWTLLSGSRANLAKLWSWFGVFYQRVAEEHPPETNWQTGNPYTFDIDHSDDVYVLGPTGRERALVQGNANVSGELPAPLAEVLSNEGRRDLSHPGLGSWTPADMLQVIGSMLGRTIAVPEF